jgi:hypothetical protein
LAALAAEEEPGSYGLVMVKAKCAETPGEQQISAGAESSVPVIIFPESETVPVPESEQGPVPPPMSPLALTVTVTELPLPNVPLPSVPT